MSEPAENDATIRALHAGQVVFRRYRLDCEAGRGGMGVVWKAQDTELDRTVAIKFLPEVIATDPEAILDLKRETRRNLELTHPGIVRVYDFIHDSTTVGISMEYVDGTNLGKTKLERPGRCFSVAELAPLAEQLCAAIEYAHSEAHIIHRDIKPANLLVTRSGKLKVTDFGIARSLTETKTRLTGLVGGQTGGTLAYMSPQQIAGDKPTVSDDIYAIGATLYELLSGKAPFYRAVGFALIKQINERQPAPIQEQRSDVGSSGEAVPKAWESAILACLDKDSARRPASAQELLKRLHSPGLATTAVVSPRKRQSASTTTKNAASSVRYVTSDRALPDEPEPLHRSPLQYPLPGSRPIPATSLFLYFILAALILATIGYGLRALRNRNLPGESGPPASPTVGSSARPG